MDLHEVAESIGSGHHVAAVVAAFATVVLLHSCLTCMSFAKVMTTCCGMEMCGQYLGPYQRVSDQTIDAALTSVVLLSSCPTCVSFAALTGTSSQPLPECEAMPTGCIFIPASFV